MCLPCLSHTMNALNIAFQSQYPHKHTVGTGLTAPGQLALLSATGGAMNLSFFVVLFILYLVRLQENCSL